MERFVVVTDSTANLPPELVAEYDVSVIPLTVHWGEETYLEGVTLDGPTFYQWLQERETLPTTSQPSPGAFIEFFQQVAEKYATPNILGIFISTEMSGTLASATQAKAELPDLHIELVDSRSVSMGLGMQVLIAARAAHAGQSLEAAVEHALHMRDEVQVIFAVDTLEYLRRGGRIGGAACFLGTTLNLKPVLHIQDGQVMPLEKVRMRRKSLQRVVEIIAERLQGRRAREMAIVYAQAEDDVALVKGWLMERFNPDALYTALLTPVVGTHAGPGALAVVFYAEE
ncbi:MAG TPA: DegV family protein [Anaerolineae bacterium]|nr:DegV family protein [Anaerolineae bacterium]HQH39315.1 DegV family protein [Anaerolineae bacterium]